MSPPTTPRRAGLWMRWRTMGFVGLRMMFHNKLKMAGTLVGVVFAVVLSNQQAGTFMGLIYKNIMFVRNAGADLWIVPRGTQTLQPGKQVSDAVLMQARTTVGAAWAEPLLYGGANVSLPGGGSEQVTLVGARAPAFHGGPWNLVAGSAAALERPDTMIFEDSDREKLGGLNLGSRREVAGYRVTVGGFTWGLLPFGPSFAFAEYDTARMLMHMDRDRMSFVLVGLRPGANLDAVQRDLQARVPDALVITGARFERSIVNYLLFRTAIGITFGTSAFFGLLVGFVIVALSMFSAVVDNLREFGTLKAIGATNSDLAKLLVVQSVVFALLGSLIGLAAVTRIADGMRSPGLAVILPWQLLVGTTVLMVVLCVVASSLALLRIRKVEPGMVFR